MSSHQVSHLPAAVRNVWRRQQRGSEPLIWLSGKQSSALPDTDWQEVNIEDEMLCVEIYVWMYLWDPEVPSNLLREYRRALQHAKLPSAYRNRICQTQIKVYCFLNCSSATHSRCRSSTEKWAWNSVKDMALRLSAGTTQHLPLPVKFWSQHENMA